VLVLEQLRRGLRGASDVEQWLGLPTLGVLPDQSGDERGTAVEQPANPHAPARHVLAFPASDYAGSLWAIMTRLRRSSDAPASKEILAITSAAPGEGKSTFASNLALASAASSARTLLVDGDPYTASVSRIFDLKRPGVSELLEGRVKFWNAVSRDPKSGLHILGARDLKSAAREFAGSEGRSIAKLLRDLREHFDLIVVDSPAILPVDGGMFVEHADRAVFIVAWESTGRGAVKEALGMLGVYRAKLAGVVLNRASPRWYRLFGAGRYLRYSTAQLANVVSRLSDRMNEKSAA
jgi:succinoglycan biosynthesis transport protein ExoP